MYRFYYYVEPCPRCKSRKTGRYIKQPITGSGYQMEESLKAGELIRFLPFEPERNGYCVSCGYEWHTRAKLRFWPSDKIRNEQIARGTEQEYARFLQNNRESRGEATQTAPAKQHEHGRMTLIDSRQKPVVELIYLDEELLATVMDQ